MTAEALDPLIHVPARLQMMAALATLPDGDQLSFKRLQDMLELTPGNLITHLRRLEEAGYLATSKTGSGPASRTSVALTHDGRHALELYATTLRGLLHGVSAGPAASGTPLARHGASPGIIRPGPVAVTATALRESGGITPNTPNPRAIPSHQSRLPLRANSSSGRPKGDPPPDAGADHPAVSQAERLPRTCRRAR